MFNESRSDSNTIRKVGSLMKVKVKLRDVDGGTDELIVSILAILNENEPSLR